MTKLKFPDHDRVELDLFRRINGSGTKRHMILTTVVASIATLGLIGFVLIEGVDVLKLCVGVMILWLWTFIIRHFHHASVVEHSPEALRVIIRGEQYLIPYTDVHEAR